VSGELGRLADLIALIAADAYVLRRTDLLFT
jgi:hypothetical protein